MFSQIFPASGRNPGSKGFLRLQAQVDGHAMRSPKLLVETQASWAPLQDVGDQGLQSVVMATILADFLTHAKQKECALMKPPPALAAVILVG